MTGECAYVQRICAHVYRDRAYSQAAFLSAAIIIKGQGEYI